MAPPPELKKSLNQRQLTMIAMGGVIGAGLFVGSGAVIKKAGPGAFLTYALCGVLIIMVMRMLAEMAVANPSTGSFADYARKAMGDWAGFSVGWLYWYFWVIVVGFEAVAGAGILNYWLEPDWPIWILSLVLMMAMTGTNLISVSSFGEFEFWFAGIKVAAIIFFLVTGGLFVLGLWPGADLDFSNLTDNGGFLPNGFFALTAAIVTVIFSMVGAEIATIAAAESQDPERAVAKAANSVITRISIFFVGSVFLLAVILPWDSGELTESPYVSAFKEIGIPYAADLMNAVVLTAVLSCLNSGMYTASRMLFVLAARREAPAWMVEVNGRGVPVKAILTSSVIGFLCVIAAAIDEDGVFLFLLNSSGAVILFVYLLIAISQIVLRYRADDSQLRVKMWLFPALSIITAAGIVAVLLQMGFQEDVRSQLTLSLLSWGVVLVLFVLNRARIARNPILPTPEPSSQARRVLVLANQTVGADELITELRRIDQLGKATYHVCVPASPIETGMAATHGAVSVWEATMAAAQERLDRTLAILHEQNLDATGELGDYRPLHALEAAVKQFQPDQIVVATLPEAESVWQRFDVVDRARSYGLPVTHVEAYSLGAPA